MSDVSEPRSISKYDLRKLVNMIQAKKMSDYGTQRYVPAEIRPEHNDLMKYLKYLANKYNINYDTHGINAYGVIESIKKGKV